MKKIACYLFGLALVGLQACDNTYNYAPIQTQNFETIEDFFEETTFLPDTFQIDQAEENTLVTEGNAEVVLPPCVLALPDGTPLCGLTGDGPCPVKIELVEMYTNKDFVLNEITTTTPEGTVLATGGVFKLKATFADSIPLQLVEGKTFVVKVPKANTPTDSTYMNLYSVDTALVAAAQWNLETVAVEDTVGYHKLTYNAFNEWFGCGYPIEVNEFYATTTISVISAEERFDAAISRVYLLYDDEHSVLGTVYDKGSFVSAELPSRTKVTAVALHTDGKELFFAKGSGEVGTDTEILIRLEQVTAEELTTELEALK